MADEKTVGALCRGEFWQQIVLSRVALARADLESMPDSATPVRDEIYGLLWNAEAAANRPGRWLWRWLFGGAINEAFVNLHSAQVLLARCAPATSLDVRLDAAMARIRSTLPPGPRLSHLESQIRTAQANDREDSRRLLLEQALEWSYGATDAQYARLRSFRNVVAVVFGALLVLLVVLAIMGLVEPNSLNLCFRPDEQPVCPLGAASSPRDVLVIEMLGAAGGALAAVFTVSGLSGTSAPYGVPVALAVLKLPVGALTGLLGLLLIHGRFVPGLEDLDTSGQILAYAVVFGIAQHAVTFFVDKRAHEILEDLPAKHHGGSPAAVRRSERSR